MTVMRRSDWTSHALPYMGTLMAPGEVEGLAVHWNGPPVSAAAARGDRDAVAALLEADRTFHVSTRGWSDIAYQWAVDNAGRRWPLRGWQRRSAANGDTDPNRHYGAVLCVIGQGQKPTAAMLDALRDTVADFRAVYPRATKVVTHNDVRPEPTACPGPDITRAVHGGALNPTTRKPTTVEDDDVTIAELKAALKNDKELRQLVGAAVLESDTYGGKTLQEILVAGANAAQAVQTKLGA